MMLFTTTSPGVRFHRGDDEDGKDGGGHGSGGFPPRADDFDGFQPALCSKMF